MNVRMWTLCPEKIQYQLGCVQYPSPRQEAKAEERHLEMDQVASRQNFCVHNQSDGSGIPCLCKDKQEIMFPVYEKMKKKLFNANKTLLITNIT